MDPSISPQKQNFSPTWVEERVTRLRDELGVGGYSPRTIRMYTLYVRKYLEGLLILGKPPEEASKHDIITFLARARTATTSNATLALMHAALTFYYKRHLNLNLIEEISIPKKAKKLPVVLTIPEIRIIFKHTPPGRNRLLLQFLYSTGCRVSEAVGMKVDQVDFDNLVANVRGGKGNKDRILILSQKWVGKAKSYVNRKKVPTPFLFSKKNGKSLSTDTIERIVRQAAQKGGLTKRVTPHVLRHSFATHLLEGGENIRKIQILLGHANLSTTSIYTHVSNEELKRVQSPFDKI